MVEYDSQDVIAIIIWGDGLLYVPNMVINNHVIAVLVDVCNLQWDGYILYAREIGGSRPTQHADLAASCTTPHSSWLS